MHIFDYSFLKNGMLSADLINVTASIYALNSGNESRKTEYASIFTELEKIAKIQSVKGSNAIEGIVTSDERIKAIVTQSSAPLNHDEKEIAGYRDALNIVHNEYDTLQFNEDNILRLHKVMMSLSENTVGGQYKTQDNAIVEINQFGQRSLRFAPVAANDTKEAMEQLVLAYMDARDDLHVNPLLLIPCVVLDFLCIHPFQDGNGRISRLISLLLLYQAGFDVGKYISFEEQINKLKGNYYNDLKLSSEGWHNNENDYMPFIKNFLTSLYICYKELDRRFISVNGKRITKSARIEHAALDSLTPISKADICELLPDISPTTVETVLGKMVKNGLLEKIGSARNTKYIKK